MHSHNRTLLSSLGFQDRDRQNPIHDRACLFLSKPDQSKRLVELFGGDGLLDRYITGGRVSSCKRNSISTESILEQELGKHHHDVVGFADLLIQWKQSVIISGYKYPGKWGSYRTGWEPTYCSAKDHRVSCRGSDFIAGCGCPSVDSHIEIERFENELFPVDETNNLLVEVKTTPLPPGDVVRQIKLYRTLEYGNLPSRMSPDVSSSKVVVATTFDVSESFKQILATENISCVKLGAGFRKWMVEQTEEKTETEQF